MAPPLPGRAHRWPSAVPELFQFHKQALHQLLVSRYCLHCLLQTLHEQIESVRALGGNALQDEHVLVHGRHNGEGDPLLLIPRQQTLLEEVWPQLVRVHVVHQLHCELLEGTPFEGVHEIFPVGGRGNMELWQDLILRGRGSTQYPDMHISTTPWSCSGLCVCVCACVCSCACVRSPIARQEMADAAGQIDDVTL